MNKHILIESADCSVRVSNELGAAHPLVAKFSVLVVNANNIIQCDCSDLQGWIERDVHK